MQDISSVTLIVTLINGITALVTATMLLLVFWQNPTNRLNQIFSLMVGILLAYSLSNIMLRYIDTFNLAPEETFYINTNLYGAFLILLPIFTLAFTGIWKRALLPAAIVMALIFTISTAITWSGKGHTYIEPSQTQGGSYVTHLTPIGNLLTSIYVVYPIISASILWRVRKKTPQMRFLWVAPTLILFGMIWTVVIWPILLIPLNGLTLAGATFILGRAVLMDQLFNPLARLSSELSIKNTQLRETDRLKSQFLANMSHELRTPLNSIIGYTDLVADGVYGDVTKQQADRLEKVTRNARSLLGLINDILDLSRIEAGNMALNIEPVNTGELLDSVLAVFEPSISEKQLTVQRDYAAVPAVLADPARARQILTNIISNAVKFTPQGHIRIKATQQDKWVQFEIEDTGIGIPTNKQHLVFEEFRQVDSTSTRQYGGTGLGMSITKRLIEMLQGKIWLKSDPGVGTTFFFTLPVATQPTAATTPHATGPQPIFRPPTAGETQLRALIIDDSNDSQLFLKDALLADTRHWQVFTASSGREGLRFAQQIQPHIILLDVMMPSMDGWQVLKNLKEDSALRHVPVIMVSAIDNRFLAHQMGASATVIKPVDQRRLQEALDSSLAPA